MSLYFPKVFSPSLFRFNFFMFPFEFRLYLSFRFRFGAVPIQGTLALFLFCVILFAWTKSSGNVSFLGHRPNKMFDRIHKKCSSTKQSKRSVQISVFKWIELKRIFLLKIQSQLKRSVHSLWIIFIFSVVVAAVNGSFYHISNDCNLSYFVFMEFKFTIRLVL